MKTKTFIAALLLFVFVSCDQLRQIAEDFEGSGPLTEQEVIRGLKQALTIGADSAATRLAVRDGYFRDAAVRISLPPEARVITDNLSYLPGGQALVDDIVLRINRAAEDAAKEAAPVFRQAVANMTIRDGFDILRGKNDAATLYLRTHTNTELYQLFQPKIKKSTDKAIVGNVSTTEAWNTLTSSWNSVAGSIVGQVAGLEKVNVDLDQYLTERALDGLFLKLAEEEEKIRTDPIARVTELLRRVFG